MRKNVTFFRSTKKTGRIHRVLYRIQCTNIDPNIISSINYSECLVLRKKKSALSVSAVRRKRPRLEHIHRAFDYTTEWVHICTPHIGTVPCDGKNAPLTETKCIHASIIRHSMCVCVWFQCEPPCQPFTDLECGCASIYICSIAYLCVPLNLSLAARFLSMCESGRFGAFR